MKEDLGSRLKQARLAAGMSQKDLSVKSGVVQQVISKIELGIVKTTSDVVSLAQSVDVTAEWLDSGDGPMSRNVAKEPRASYKTGPGKSDFDIDSPYDSRPTVMHRMTIALRLVFQAAEELGHSKDDIPTDEYPMLQVGAYGLLESRNTHTEVLKQMKEAITLIIEYESESHDKLIDKSA